MPYKRKTNYRRKSRRNYRRKTQYRKRGKVNAVIAKGIGNLGDRLFIPLRYTQQVTLTCTAGALAYQLFSGNSAYDPDYSGAGSQPEGWDQFTALFQYYRVHASKIKLDITSKDTSSATQTVNLALVPRNDTNNEATIEAAMCAPFSKHYAANLVNGARNKPLVSKMKTTKIYGLPNKGLKYMDGWQAATTADPVNEWTWAFYCQPVDKSSGSVVTVMATIIYYVEFYMRANLNLS